MKLKKIAAFTMATLLSFSCVSVMAGTPSDSDFDGDVNKNPFESIINNETQKTTNDKTTNDKTVNKGNTDNKSTSSSLIPRAKVKKAIKKKGTKKVKITLKKLKNIKGYQIQVSKKKKFKKKNIILKKFIKKKKLVKKAKFTVKGKKIRKRKKLWVRARAYKVENGKKVFGKWSKAKKAKIK